MFGMDRVASRIITGLIAIALLCVIGFGVSYCRGRDALKTVQAEKTLGDGRMTSAVEAIDAIGKNRAANDAVREDVKDAQEKIRAADPADRDRVARCELRNLQGLPPC